MFLSKKNVMRRPQQRKKSNNNSKSMQIAMNPEIQTKNLTKSREEPSD
jgi:hypothetical protein